MINQLHCLSTPDQHPNHVKHEQQALKAELRKRALAGGATLLPTAVDATSVQHTAQGSVLTCADGTRVQARMIVDCAGYASQLVELDGAHDPGVQVAYGIEAECDVCPYAEDAMTLMDYRTDYFGADAAGEVGNYCMLLYVYGYVDGDPSPLNTHTHTHTHAPTSPHQQAAAAKEPTFMYAMPMGPTADGQRVRVFFEETSLVARPPMTFDECKRRMELRLAHLGAKVLAVEEEEFCYIPMGGVLPKREQRVVAFGGALGLVHPATGYQICRALAAAGPAAKAVASEVRMWLGRAAGLCCPAPHVCLPAWRAPRLAHQPFTSFTYVHTYIQLKRATGAAYDPDAAARRIYDSVWSHQTRLQRDFSVFGGEFLMLQEAGNLRGFFDSFFRLPTAQWTVGDVMRPSFDRRHWVCGSASQIPKNVADVETKFTTSPPRASSRGGPVCPTTRRTSRGPPASSSASASSSSPRCRSNSPWPTRASPWGACLSSAPSRPWPTCSRPFPQPQRATTGTGSAVVASRRRGPPSP